MRRIGSIRGLLALASLCAGLIALMPADVAAQRIIKVRDLDSLPATKPAATKAAETPRQPIAHPTSSHQPTDATNTLTCIAGCGHKRTPAGQ
jgi:hypothetical protein